MIGEPELRDALSRHLAAALTAGTTGNKLAYAVTVAEAGFCPFGAFNLARAFVEGTARESGYADDLARVMGEQAAFVAGLVVGRTARDAEVNAEEAEAA